MGTSTLPLPGLSPVCGKTVIAKFDGGLLSSDGGILMLRELEQRLRVADHLAGCIEELAAAEPRRQPSGCFHYRRGWDWKDDFHRNGDGTDVKARRPCLMGPLHRAFRHG